MYPKRLPRYPPLFLFQSSSIVKRLSSKRTMKGMMHLEAGKRKGRKPRQATSRKGCMKGKGGPENSSCTFKGVRQRTWGKWVAEIREPNRGPRLWLGTFDTSYEAAMAYDDAARRLYGSEAKLNLPQQPATTCFPPPSGSLPIEYPERVNAESEIPNYQYLGNEGSSQNTFWGADTGSVFYDKNPTPMFENLEEMNIYGLSENLNANLPNTNDSSIWAEIEAEAAATATMDYQAMPDPGCYGDFENEKNWEAANYPWRY